MISTFAGHYVNYTVIIWWPVTENHWPRALAHWILEDVGFLQLRFLKGPTHNWWYGISTIYSSKIKITVDRAHFMQVVVLCVALHIQPITGQVSVFNVHIQSKLLKRTPVTGTGTGQDRKKPKGGGGDCLHWQVQGSTSSPTAIGSRWRVVWGVMKFGMSRRIKPK